MDSDDSLDAPDFREAETLKEDLTNDFSSEEEPGWSDFPGQGERGGRWDEFADADVDGVSAAWEQRLSAWSKKMEEWTLKYEGIMLFLEKEENRDGARRIWREVKRLLIRLKPRHVEGSLRFGFEDPAVTGGILAAASLFYPLYEYHFDLEADFEEAVFEGEGRIGGALRLWWAAGALLRLVCRRNVRDLIRQIKKLGAGG